MVFSSILVHFFQFQILLVVNFWFPKCYCASVHIGNKKKDILVLGEGPTQRLGDTTITTETKYIINFTRSKSKFCLSLN